MEKNLVRRIRGWRNPERTCFFVLRDQDSGNCIAVLQNLKALCIEAGRPDTIIRIACRELESWYLGDLRAVEQGLNLKNLARHQNSKKYRAPDLIGKPSKELQKLTSGGYQKIAGSRAIGRHLSPDGNRSYSFYKLVEGLRRSLDCLLAEVKNHA